MTSLKLRTAEEARVASLEGLPAAALQRVSLMDQAVAMLRSHIIAGDIAPGTVLVERDVAAMLGISRAPTREALLKLESTGLVVNSRNRRRVIEPTERELAEMFEVRAPLELLASERAAVNTNPRNAEALAGCLRDMEAAVQSSDREAFIFADFRFHEVIWEQSGNSYLENALNAISGPIFMAIVNGTVSDGDWNQIIVSHREIVESINSGDPSRAATVARASLAEQRHKLSVATEPDVG